MRRGARIQIRAAVIAASLLVLLVLLVLLAAPLAAQGASLGQRVERAMLASSAGARTSVVVWDQETRQILYSRAADQAVAPASNMKLLTSAALMQHFGPDHRFSTRVALVGRQAGTRWIGSVVLVGGGDPSLSTDAFARDNYAGAGANLGVLTLPLRKRGITRVTGRIFVVDGHFDRARWVPEWPSRFRYDQAAALGALTVNQSSSGRWIGARASRSPAVFAGEAYRNALEGVGILVRGGTIESNIPAGAKIVGGVASPPLSVLLKHLNSTSDNFYAEILLKGLGRDVYGPGGGTTARGRTAAYHVLKRMGLNVSSLRWVDGSGLSSSNRVSARLVASVLGVGAQAEWGSPWIDGFAIGGVRGTLRKRFRDAPYRGRVYAKTGTLRQASALSGFALRSGPRKRAYGFVALSWRPDGGGIDVAASHRLQDKIAMILVR